MLPPPTHTPLIALPALVLDLETTGLDIRTDRVVQVAAIAMQGDVRNKMPELESLVNPQQPIPERSSAIHGILDKDVVGAPRFTDIADKLREIFSGRVIVGHNIGFDIAILRHEFAREGLPWHEPVAIDIGQLVGALQPALPDLGLETVTSALGVSIQHRHSALGDCEAAAEVWARLVPILREREIRTLGETVSLAGERQDLLLHQAQAGWFSIPGELVTAPAPSAPRIDSYVFEQRLADVMSSPPAFIAQSTVVRAAARVMTERGVGALLVGDETEPAAGIVTESDLLRMVAQHDKDPDTAAVSEIMSSPVESMRSDEMLYRALGRMDRTGVRHLCVINETGAAVGMVSQRDLLQHRARGQDMLSDALEAANDAPSLAAAFAQVTPVASRLMQEDLDGVDIARVVSTELQALTGRAARLCIDAMQADGKGPPPSDWCVLVLGSGGRGESLLGADQDNALIHTGNEKDDAWFAEFGARLADLLDAAGVPRCKGDVMAASAQWRGSISIWNRRVDDWLRRARPQDLLNVDIFFDLAAVAGNADLAHRLHHDAVRAASKTPPFLGLLAQSVLAIPPRFSLLGRLPAKDGRIDLKRDGLLPLVSLARTLALRVGARSRATPERLRDAAAAGRLPDADAARLISLHTLILTLILEQQLLDRDEGIATSNTVVLRRLAKKQQSELMKGLHHLDTLVHEVQSLISG